MSKKHWITLEGGPTVDEKLVRQLSSPTPTISWPQSGRPPNPRSLS